jgi:hypothetical protein
MSRHFLLSTPEGLRALQARQPAKSIQGPHGFISTEVVFRDARSAHDLQAALRTLFLAAAQVHQETRAPRGRISRQALADLTAALVLAREWL